MKKTTLNLLALTTIVLLSGCGKNNNSTSGGSEPSPNPKIPSITGAITGDEDRWIDTGLHDINVEESDVVLVNAPFAQGLSSAYKVVYDASASQRDKSLTAAKLISQNILEATGATLEVVAYGDSYVCDADARYIYVGCRDAFDKAGLTMPQKDGKQVDLGISGYYIKTQYNSCFIEVDRPHGYQMAAIAFSKAVLGYDYYTDDFTTYTDFTNAEKVYLPKMDIVELPDFDSRNYVNNGSTAKLYALGYQKAGEIFIPVGNNAMHNCDKWLPFDKYGAAHRGWYEDTRSPNGYQLCYTAHGNEDQFNQMVDACLVTLEDAIKTYPQIENITLTQLDAPTCCECETCSAVVRKDGSISATIIRFINALDNKFREKHPDSKLNILFFAYQASLAAPSTPVEEDPTLKCNEHVFPIIAPINANYTRSFYDEVNEQYANNFTSWSKYCSRFCAWIYECNYKHYMYPYNSYQSMVDTYKFLKQYNTAIMYNEGQRYNTAIPCFGRFKDYIDSKLNVNVNVRFSDLKRTYFDNYYGDAGVYMEQLYNEMTSWTEYVEQTYMSDPGYLYEDIDASEDYWPKPMMEHYLDLCDKAYEAIAPLRIKDPIKYKAFYEHINIESMFPRYVLCDLYAYLYGVQTIRDLRLTFKKDCQELGIQEYCEVHTFYPVGEQGWMSEKFTEWGIN